MLRFSNPLRSAGISLSMIGLLAHCGGGDLTFPGGNAPAAIDKLDGDRQIGAAGAALPRPLVVKVTDSLGTPVASQIVAFTLDPEVDGASVSPGTARTQADGTARANWVLGGASGTQGVIARVVGADELAVRFDASVGPAPAQRIELVGGTDQRAPVGTALPQPLVVVVTDVFGNPVPDIEVEWDASSGTLDPESSATGPDGRASSSWVLGSSLGAHTATAMSGELEGSPVTFTATAEPGSANRLLRVSGNGQSARPGQELAEPLVVRLVDRDGNGISGRAVTWVVGAGGGRVDATTSSTDANGEARARWTLGPTPGTNTLNAVVSGVGVAGFTATATGGGGGGGGGGESVPSRLEFRVQPSDTPEDQTISPPVEVVVLDQNGSRFTGGDLEIMLELSGNRRGDLEGDRNERTQAGIAVFNDLRVDRRGEYRLRASADGLPSVESDRFNVSRRDKDDDDD
jgi:hypothetical protein